MTELCTDFRPLVYSFSWAGPGTDPQPLPKRRELPAEEKKAVRDLLRAGGYKPSGRGRPASESLVKALCDERYPTIHPVVDFFNYLSVETGLPISVLDAGSIQGDWSFRLGADEESYVFHPSGQELKVSGLLVLVDDSGPTGSPVKDAQRTKVSASTTEFLVVIWGTNRLSDNIDRLTGEVKSWAKKHDLQLK